MKSAAVGAAVGVAFGGIGRGVKAFVKVNKFTSVRQAFSKVGTKRQFALNRKWGIGLPKKNAGGRIFSIYNRTKTKHGRLFGVDRDFIPGSSNRKVLHYHWKYTPQHRTLRNPRGR